MKISINKGNRVIVEASDEAQRLKDIKEIRRKEKFLEKESTLSASLYIPEDRRAQASDVARPEPEQEEEAHTPEINADPVVEENKDIQSESEEETEKDETTEEDKTAEDEIQEDKEIEENKAEEESDEEDDDMDEEEEVRYTPNRNFNTKSKFTDNTNESYNTPKKSSNDVINDFFAKEERDARIYGTPKGGNRQQYVKGGAKRGKSKGRGGKPISEY